MLRSRHRRLRRLGDTHARYSTTSRKARPDAAPAEVRRAMSAPLSDEILLTDDVISAASEVLWKYPLLDITEPLAEMLTRDVILRALETARKTNATTVRAPGTGLP